ncbi:hypothetical protein PHAVU_006G035900, partial [Phaseolus vulgaris]|uniref:Uncharacterized protein n=1 Tax=Phaseolus vulgaris TaxID=3885 RepID=V7BK61_PHAVU|nr:hypothetical protein PHAVU_006G035900g [Phaseolus vulgaris]XP_007146386.1 hypothetical protein PHAVU_006G035900g [Phaseolus vulgaris]XP_007146387.1 hypothetical protein PHAVU_006G035900g [Phaseolus vulgaris]ESW18379.1 hypothetical protein PHAVU_006G035900g [Phaseolus vulgaris]ESW18380.1 hypothetical protein PHAVU_006G035900g [Phaseolus vulgaris]ESW18381.1 hypothetical protein PHAVU_006G035900g [Phaseolus vulgaris]
MLVILMNVEKFTKGRDLSPVTDKLRKKFFEKQFGTNSTNEVIKRMKEKKVSFKWVQLYEAKGKEMAQTENEALDRIKQLYKKEDASMILVPVFFNVFLVFLLCLGKVPCCAFVYIVLLLINVNS